MFADISRAEQDIARSRPTAASSRGKAIGKTPNAKWTASALAGCSLMLALAIGLAGVRPAQAQVTSVTCGSGLTGGTITSTGTCAVASPISSGFLSGAYSGITNVGALNGLTVNANSGPLALNGAIQTAKMAFQTNSNNRWTIGLHPGGGDTDILALSRYNDAGTFIDDPVHIYRTNGTFIFNDGVAFGDNGVNDRMTFKPGNTAPVAGSAIQVDVQFTDGVNSVMGLGGAFPGSNTYAGLGLSKSWDSSYNGSTTPAATVFSTAFNTGTSNSPMPFAGICQNKVTGGVCFGGNLILGDDGHTAGTLQGLEIDMEPQTSPTANSNGLVVGGFNVHQGNAIAVFNVDDPLHPGLASWENGLNLAAPFTRYTGTQILGNGFHIDPSGNYVGPSDIRLKTVIKPVTRAVDALSTLKPFYYTCKTGHETLCTQPGVTKIGLSAQDVEKVYPELVDTDKDGWKSLNYAGLVTPLIEAVKELKADNDQLRREVEALKQARP